MSRRTAALALALLTAPLLAACGSSDSKPGAAASAPASATASSGTSFADVEAQAKGQTVNWYMYGGDDVLNTFVNGYLKTKLAARGVTLNQVKITDTVTAVNKVLAEKQAGKTTDGSVDAIWINGENFATGKQADLWYCGYAQSLANARYVDFSQPAVANDFGLPVEGCESVWMQANSALVYDSTRLTKDDVKSASSLFDWAKAHPGKFTYPAPPDFTGSMAVRTFFYDTNDGPDGFAGQFDEAKYAPAATKLWKRLNDLEPSLYKKGKTYPAGEPDVEKLYANGEISAFLTYGPGAVGDAVKKGTFPATTREAVFEGGNISNYNFLAIPFNSPHKAAAQVLQDTLLDPQTQLELYKSSGSFPGIDLAKTDPATQAAFKAVSTSPAVLPLDVLSKDAQPELTSTYVTRIEKDWKANVLQK
ncbi:MAG: transporter substrate-binding protein [Frankiales bacterium]|nr:transporter substrate-binding protein [Frankiales bacterium]